MNAIQQSIALWAKRGWSEHQFWEDVQLWAKRGCFIHIRPDHCACAQDMEGEAWFIYLAVGRLKDIIPLLPYELPMVGWEREIRNQKGVRYYPLRKVLALSA